MGDLERILAILQEVRYRAVRVAAVLIPIFAFLITFELRPLPVDLFGARLTLAYPYPSLFYNVAAQAFQALRAWALPPDVVLLNLGVGDSVIAQVEVAAILTLILGMPWIVHEVAAFLVPALRAHETELLRRIGIPATALFATGTLLGLLWLTPLTYRLLFLYVGAMGAAPAIGVEAFVEFTLLYSFAFGIAFELPVFIYGLTRLGVVRAASWRRHWRGAILGALLFGLLVTPDNSGITMLLVAAPMIALYFGGLLVAERWERARNAPKAPPERTPAIASGG